MADYTPKPEHKFTFGLWTVGNIGRDPFGEPTRDPISPVAIVRLLAEVGAWGVNLHDNDLVPIDAAPAERDQHRGRFQSARWRTPASSARWRPPISSPTPPSKTALSPATIPAVRAYALQKTMSSMDLGAELGAKVYVFWGGREGAESDSAKNPADGVKRMRDAINFLCEYSKAIRTTATVLRWSPSPTNRAATSTSRRWAACSASSPRWMTPIWLASIPEVAHEHMAGLNFMHAVAQAWDAGKLFHIDLNDQMFGRYDQDFRFGSMMIKQNFHLVRFLEDVGYDGSRHFDAHAYRSVAV